MQPQSTVASQRQRLDFTEAHFEVLQKFCLDVALLDSTQSKVRMECRIAFEDYLRKWLKIATTKAGLLIRKESLEELVKCADRFAGRYVMPGSASDDFTKDQRRICKGVMYSPNLRNLKTHSKKKLARVNQMRRLYLLRRTPELLTQQVPSIKDPEASECWESEVDNLVSWTHSLSFEELDRE